MQKLFINTWVFEAEIKSGVTQAELVKRVAELGADGIEVRREYFKDLTNELPAVHEAAQKDHLAVALSVPDELFVAGKLNTQLANYLVEGRQLGASKLKFNLGDFANYQGDLTNDFSFWPSNIALNIENDQTEVSGHLEPIANFLKLAKEAGVKIGYVYDLGNWAYTKGDAELAATELAPYADYLHFKNVAKAADGSLTVTTDLSTGVFDWRKLYALLPATADVALEFPMPDDATVKTQVDQMHIAMKERQ